MRFTDTFYYYLFRLAVASVCVCVGNIKVQSPLAAAKRQKYIIIMCDSIAQQIRNKQ